MKAGFSKAVITPPIGTRMSGFGGRDRQKGCEAINDDLFVSVLYLREGGEEIVIAGFDLLFFAREYAGSIKSAIGRALNLPPRCILINTSHTHSGPCVDRWGYNMTVLPDFDYLNFITHAVVNSALDARQKATEVTVWSGEGNTKLPVSRRKPDGKGGVEWRPYPEGVVYRHLPVCLFRDLTGEPICLLYSVACHPSTMGGWIISADYPGSACRLLDSLMGKSCALFLQGAGGDSKVCIIADGRDEIGPCWRSGTPTDVERAGRIVAEEVNMVVESGLTESKPLLKSTLIETQLPLRKKAGREEIAEMVNSDNEVKRMAGNLLQKKLERFGEIPDKASLLMQGIQLAEDVRIVAIEGEIVGELGLMIKNEFNSGVVFPLGYSNGTGLYLPTTRMLKEGGYECESFYEYGFASPLREGIEDYLLSSMKNLKLK